MVERKAMYTREPDFEAKIRLLTKQEGGRNSLPFQGYRSNFIYEGEDPHIQYSIWPEFLDANKMPIPIKEFITSNECFANFYIFDKITKESIHRGKIIVGVKFNMMEGARIIGKGTVTQVYM